MVPVTLPAIFNELADECGGWIAGSSYIKEHEKVKELAAYGDYSDQDPDPTWGKIALQYLTWLYDNEYEEKWRELDVSPTKGYNGVIDQADIDWAKGASNSKALANMADQYLNSKLPIGSEKDNDDDDDGTSADDYQVVPQVWQETPEWATVGTYNPPPHVNTRSFNPAILRSTHADRYSNLTDEYIDSRAESWASTARGNDMLGYIFQDPASTAGSFNMTQQDTARQNARRGARSRSGRWGFQFTYNPTSLSYGASVDSSTDFTLPDPSVPTKSAVAVNFQLWLNRIEDVRTLTENQPAAKGYQRTLNVDEVNGILKRGTEFDMEFLYRVVNGDPSLNQPTISYSDSYGDYRTANTGLFAGRPVWLALGGQNSNMRYWGIINSINVTHMLFTQQMVPVLSTLDINFIRYPTNFLTTRTPRDGIPAVSTAAAKPGDANFVGPVARPKPGDANFVGPVMLP